MVDTPQAQAASVGSRRSASIQRAAGGVCGYNSLVEGGNGRWGEESGVGRGKPDRVGRHLDLEPGRGRGRGAADNVRLGLAASLAGVGGEARSRVDKRE